MPPKHEASGYAYTDESSSHAHEYLMPVVTRTLQNYFNGRPGTSRRVFDLGCGNGSVAATLTAQGYQLAGVDPSAEGITLANTTWPELSLHCGSAYDDLTSQYGTFPAVISLEVVEHVYAPREFARTLYSLVEPGGIAIVSTPYHGYVKNVALALSGRMDGHFTALWDHGHIKFWSIRTLSTLLREAGFGDIRFHRVGRTPFMAKSMVAICTKA